MDKINFRGSFLCVFAHGTVGHSEVKHTLDHGANTENSNTSSKRTLN